MMKWTLIPLILILAACDPTPPPEPETERQPNVIFETQIKTLDKAHEVEQQMQDAAEAQRRQLDEATQQ